MAEFMVLCTFNEGTVMSESYEVFPVGARAPLEAAS